MRHAEKPMSLEEAQEVSDRLHQSPKRKSPDTDRSGGRNSPADRVSSMDKNLKQQLSQKHVQLVLDTDITKRLTMHNINLAGGTRVSPFKDDPRLASRIQPMVSPQSSDSRYTKATAKLFVTTSGMKRKVVDKGTSLPTSTERPFDQASSENQYTDMPLQ